jgi:HK97 family phage portal protein
MGVADLGRRLTVAWRSFWNPALPTRDPALAAYFGIGPTASGEPVSEWTALNFSAVWAAIQCIAGAVGSLPLFLYKRLPNGGKERFVDHPLYEKLHDQPNPEMTSMVWRETIQAHVLSWGNGYCEIQRDQANRVVALWPITPDRVTPDRRQPGGELFYRVLNPTTNREVEMAPEDVLHIPGLGFDGVKGYSVIAKAREAIGMGLAYERFGNTFFANGAGFGGALQFPRPLSDKAMTNLRTSIEARHKGPGKAHQFVILEDGGTWASTSMPLDDAQFLQGRKFQVTEIARWFNMPPHKLRDLERATFSNIEEQQIEFVTDTIRPWLVRWEQEINRKLIRPAERRIQFAEHLVDGLLRGNLQQRYQAYAVGRQWGWLSADDVNDMENRNPLPNGQGQIYLVPTNMAPADKIDAIVDAQTAPAPQPAEPQGPDPDDRMVTILVAIQERVEVLAARPEPPALTAPDPTPVLLERLEAIEGRLRQELQAGLAALPTPPAPEPMAPQLEGLRETVAATGDALAARITEVVREVEATIQSVRASMPAPAAPPDLEPVTAQIQQTSESLRHEVLAAAEATAARITQGLATDQALRDWQGWTIQAIAGRLVRREVTQLRKRSADPERALERLTAFYERWTEDSVAELKPWLLRIRPGSLVVSAVDARVARWAAEAQAQCEAALADGGLEAVARRWEVEREDALARAIMEVVDGGA